MLPAHGAGDVGGGAALADRLLAGDPAPYRAFLLRLDVQAGAADIALLAAQGVGGGDAVRPARRVGAALVAGDDGGGHAHDRARRIARALGGLIGTIAETTDGRIPARRHGVDRVIE